MTQEVTKVNVLGMSLRDMYAGMAMQAFLSNPKADNTHEIAAAAFRMANAMMEKRNP